MYRGFNLKLPELRKNSNYWDYYIRGESAHAENMGLIDFNLNNFLNQNNSLDGSAIQDYWFPAIDADVFISHSHISNEYALVVAGWLEKNFGLKSFIDSSVWGNSNDLLWNLDVNHSRNKNDDAFSYQLRNHSTTHVHMMLASALNMMIDKCECLFFLNTPSSIKPFEQFDKTESPWLYYEIATSKTIQKKEPGRYQLIHEQTSHFDSEEDEIKKSFEYKLDLSHMSKIDLIGLRNWRRRKNIEHPLDTLYRIFPAPRIQVSELLK